jgi:hypothetical protein
MVQLAGVALSPYDLSFFSGALFIALFAFDRLNRPSYEAAVQQKRLLKLLNPADLQRRSAFLKAYVVYTALLLFVYALLCLSGGSLLVLFVTDPAGLPSTFTTAEEPTSLVLPFAGDPQVPLYVALLLVGVFPALPQLQAVEGILRRLAHALAGIPHRVFAAANAVETTPLDLSDLGESELSAAKKEEIAAIVGRAEAVVGGGAPVEQFARQLVKAHMLRHWLGEPGRWAGAANLGSFADLERELQPAFSALEEDLRDLADDVPAGPATGLAEAPAAGFTGAPEAAATRTAATRWSKAFDATRAVHDDLCLLFALYLTRAGLRTELGAAPGKLKDFVLRTRRNAKRAYEGFDILVAYLVVLAASMFVAGFGLAAAGLYGGSEAEPIRTAAAFLVSVLQIYFPAGFAAILVREGARARGSWSTWGELNHPPATQLLEVFALSYAASAVVLVGFGFLMVASGDFDVDLARFRETGLLEEQLFLALLGGVHAIFFVVELDARADEGLAQRLRALPLGHGTALAAVCYFILLHLYSDALTPVDIAVSAALAFLFGAISGAFTVGRLGLVKAAPARDAGVA